MIEKLVNEFYELPKLYGRIAESTGENFNIFRLLNIEYEEVRLHSMFLATLLNPQGMHGQKDTFLKLFLQQLKIGNFDSITAKVAVEFYIGTKTNETGGYIDILIQDNIGNCIIIENKIYAADQENQMLRYFNYGNSFKTRNLFYLTLCGKEASPLSTGGKLERGKDYRSMSYSTILLWLQNCLEEVISLPIIRETISQYIHSLKFLTNQSVNQKMNTEIVDNIFSNEEKLNAYLHLISNDSVKSAIYNRIYGKLESDLKEIANRLNLQMYFDMNREKLYSGFSFSNEDTEKLNLKISYMFLEKHSQHFIIGFKYIDHKKAKMPVHQKIAHEFKNGFGLNLSTQWFLCYGKHSKYANWGPVNHERANIGEIAKYIEEELSRMLAIINTIKDE